MKYGINDINFICSSQRTDPCPPPILPRPIPRTGSKVCEKFQKITNIINLVMVLYRLILRHPFSYNLTFIPYDLILLVLLSYFLPYFLTFCYHFHSFNRITSAFCDTRELMMLFQLIASDSPHCHM